MFKFSTSQVMINEDFGEYFNLSIIKIGHNEPNVTIEIGVTEPRLDVSLQGKLTTFCDIILPQRWIHLLFILWNSVAYSNN